MKICVIVNVGDTGMRNAVEVMRNPRRRTATGQLPRLPATALEGPRTLDRTLPGLFLLAFVSLLIIQVLIAV